MRLHVTLFRVSADRSPASAFNRTGSNSGNAAITTAKAITTATIGTIKAVKAVNTSKAAEAICIAVACDRLRRRPAAEALARIATVRAAAAARIAPGAQHAAWPPHGA